MKSDKTRVTRRFELEPRRRTLPSSLRIALKLVVGAMLVTGGLFILLVASLFTYCSNSSNCLMG
jgi:hypothetical protein